MKKKKSYVLEKIVFLILTILLLALLGILFIRKNTIVENKRRQEDLVIVENIMRKEIEDENGYAIEFTFPLDTEISHDTELTFYKSHHWIDIWIGETHVYSLKPSTELDFIKTPGGKWVILPIFREDAGKMVRVVMTPVYEDYVAKDVEIFIGSSLKVYQRELKQELIAIILSFLNISVGIGLIPVAIYCRYIKQKGMDIVSLSVIGITIGLWQLTNNDFSMFFLSGKEIYLYYVSVTMLLVCTIPLVRSASVRLHSKEKKILYLYLAIAAVLAIIELLLQLLGVVDLRQMFPIIHGNIFIGAVLLIGSAIYERIKGYGRYGNVWILAVGVLCDLLLYYIRGTASGLLMLLLAVLIFVLLEGVTLLFYYMKQKQLLEETEIRLINSRAITMTSQIRSHFVFNVLNAISGMCKYNPEKADETIIQFSRYLRNNIGIMEDDKMCPFPMVLQRLEDYVALEQVRFGDKIVLVTDFEITNFQMPSLIIQPIVENAIRHGISKKENGGTILLSTWEEDDTIFIEINDDGVGFDMQALEKEESVGLKNIRFRLQYLAHGTLTIHSKIGNGTKVTITLPGKELKICE